MITTSCDAQNVCAVAKGGTVRNCEMARNRRKSRAVLFAEYFRWDLEIAGLSKALDALTTHENVNVKKRALIILTRIKTQKIAEQE